MILAECIKALKEGRPYVADWMRGEFDRAVIKAIAILEVIPHVMNRLGAPTMRYHKGIENEEREKIIKDVYNLLIKEIGEPINEEEI